MAWIYLRESGGSRSRYRRGSGQLPIVSLIALPRELSSPEYSICRSQTPEFGTMLEVSREVISQFSQTSSTEDSPARISVLQELEVAWMASEAPLFSNSSGWSGSADLNSFSWRMSQTSLFGDSDEFSWSCMHWGMMLGGRLCQPAELEQHTCVGEHSHLPTPTATDHKRGFNGTQGGYLCLPALAARGVLNGHPKGLYNPEWTEQAMNYPQGWTELEPWAMQWFRSRRGKHSKA